MYIKNTLTSKKKSFETFLIDTFQRSFEFSDWVYQESKTIKDLHSNLDKEFSEEYKYYFYCIFVSMIKTIEKSIKISNGSKNLTSIFIDYHEKFGWILDTCDNNSNSENKIFLGKISLLDNTKVVMGRKSFISGPSIIKGGGKLKIGSFCSFGENLRISTANENHPMEHASTINWYQNERYIEDWINEPISYVEFDNDNNEVVIGSDVWIGRNVTISSGVKIGDGCIIGQGSFVREDCKAFGIYAGYPAKLIRYRFSSKCIAQLKDVKWWNWSMELIKKNTLFFNTNLKTFEGDIKVLINF